MQFLNYCLKILKNSFFDLNEIIYSVKKIKENYLSLDYSDQDKKKILKLCNLRATGIPIEYIVHKADFAGISFFVNENVLIPRSDSEFMIFQARKNTAAKKVLDLGSGSGCLSISYTYYSSNVQEVTFLDKSLQAIEVSKINYNKIIPQVKSIFINSDWRLFLLNNNNVYDMIFFNPPYIDEKNDQYDISLKYEPKLALFANHDAMEHYNFVLSTIASNMNDNSELYVELSYTNSNKVSKLCDQNNLAIEEEIYDMNHLRAFKIKKRKIFLPYDIISFVKKFKDSIRLVGGSVRDLLLNKQITDYDFCTSLIPDKIIEKAKKNNWKYLTHGYDHGVISILYKKYVFEVSSLRSDVNCDGRFATVKYGVSYEEDAKRRDFTINALSYDIRSNKLFDYFHGINDLFLNKVKFVGDAQLRIEEDYLRILRYFRFLTRYGSHVEYEEIIRDNAHRLKILSTERIIYEFNSIFSNTDNSKLKYIIEQMYRLNIFKELFGVDIINLENAILCGDVNLVYATLFYCDLNIYKKMSRNNVREIHILKRFFLTRDYAEIIILYMDNKISLSLIDKLRKIQNFDLPKEEDFIRGSDILQLGYKGNEIAIIRKKMVEEKIIPNIKKMIENKK